MNLPKLKIGNLEAKFPIIQGGMGIGVSMSKLASAVANEGGIGIISGAQTGYREDDFKTNNNNANINGIKKEIRLARELSPNGIIGINFLQASYNYIELVKTAVEEKIDLIISGAGLPKTLPEYVIGTNTKIAPIVSSGRAAKLLTKLWKKKYDYLPDLIVVEGPRAGGHLGFSREDLESENVKSLKELVIEVLEAIKPFEEKYNQKIPVVAAGGIYTGQEIKEFIDLGAAGVQMATRFVATHECDAHINFKNAYVNATEKDIQLIKSPVGMPGRALTNELTKSFELNSLKITGCYKCLKGCNPVVAPFCITDALVKAVEGDIKNGLVFIGSNGYKINKIISVKELFNELKNEYFA
ncbi:nitronate monooxygenase [Clostridiaceae bacterium HSG29]|nr:nitronate monooxygenase [Clostridiaceae bacterium HSG29]